MMEALSRSRRVAPLQASRFPLKLELMHLWRNGYWPNLEEPRTFNELVHLRKLRDRSPLLPLCGDKIRVKEYVERRLGSEWVIPTLWHGTELPERPEWPSPFVVKSSHASHQCAFVRTGEEDWPALRRRAQRWLRRSYGRLLDEWLYDEIEPRLLVEPYVGDVSTLPLDYKFFVFGGRAEFIQIDTDREHAHKRTLYDRQWRRLPMELQYPVEEGELPAPAPLAAMIEAAEALSSGFDFVRVDLYDIEGRPFFGEMTFYPGAGLDRFRPTAFDHIFGARWLDARGEAPSW